MHRFAFISTIVATVRASRFEQCLLDVQNGKWGLDGALDHRGAPVHHVIDAVALSYDLCVSACGGRSKAFNWIEFYQQFSTWLLPYLALLSQLPFGTDDWLSNLLSICLTVGSPTLAAYSLAVTVLNGRWISSRLRAVASPTAATAADVLQALQQSPMRINTEDDALAALALPENGAFWGNLHDSLRGRPSVWTVAGVSSISWVIVSYILTVIDSSINTAWSKSGPSSGASRLHTTLTDFGWGAGLVWFWLVPITFGWMQISPRCDSAELQRLVKASEEIIKASMPSGEKERAVTDIPCLSVDPAYADPDPLARAVHYDTRLSSPVYNYARVFLLHAVVEEVGEAFAAGAERARIRRVVDPQNASVASFSLSELPTEIEVRMTAQDRRRGLRHRSARKRHVYPRIVVASIFALMLQWGTTGGAMIVLISSPTTGLSCQSSAFLTYASLSTIVWILLLSSSILAHHTCPDAHLIHSDVLAPRRSPPRVLGAALSVVARRAGKVLAAFNTLWLLGVNLAQFGNAFVNCWCSSGVISRGARAYNLVRPAAPEFATMRAGWVCGVALSTGSAVCFLALLNMLRVRGPAGTRRN